MEKKTCRKWRKAVLLTLALGMLFGVTAMAKTVSTVELKKTSSDLYQFTGAWDEKDTTVYHKIKVNQSGLLAVSGCGFNNNYNTHGINVTLCNNKKKSLARMKNGNYVNGVSDGNDALLYFGVKKAPTTLRQRERRTISSR